ncbi:haloalkane dehalogenase [Robiginitalea aurantiaca]|uniref:Haloalkane dehalogenase n=1 Tax=Robiginitalea aurantiaca TaxID=3056915 RepID=A0ABT7WCM2_9FLAO|nr:haloalkane dehalogenase [Robiginitalea aurantiaca]MDM9630679.1 haloalkane dehalogenase [Robiginitalea aurantiaca]
MENILRTPEERFENLPGYNFKPNYQEVAPALRMHYLDEGKKENPTVLLLHGEPTWSYLYRKMIPGLSDHFRVVAPDLIGFGKSDKPADRATYSYQKHLDWLTALILNLGLTEILLFGQDWGGLTGLRLVAQMPDRFSMIIASNTTLPTGSVPMPESFMNWRAYSQHSETFEIGKIIDTGTSTDLSDDVRAGYNAPFPTEAHKAGARVFPVLVPIDPEDPEAANNRKAWNVLQQWEKPFLTVFGSEDTIMKGAEKAFQNSVPGAQGQAHKILKAGHFIQEDQGEALAEIILEFYQSNTPVR